MLKLADPVADLVFAVVGLCAVLILALAGFGAWTLVSAWLGL